jgi:hypothetical protein
MIRALRDDPEAFEIRHNCIRHRPSRHWLAFDDQGNARIFSRCSCAELPISRDQSEALMIAAAAWEDKYWRPMMAQEAAARRVAEISRQFARHFRRRSRLQRVLDACLSLIGVLTEEPADFSDPFPPAAAEWRARPPAPRQQAEKSELFSA